MGLLQWGEQRWQYRIQPTASDPVTAWQVQCTPQHAESKPISLSFTHVQWLDSARSTLAVECDGLREQVCSYMCPHARLQSAMIDGAFGDGTFTWLSSWPFEVET